MTLQYFDLNLIHDKEYIRTRYRELARKHHPDRPSGDAKVMQDINREYDIMLGGFNAQDFLNAPNQLSHIDRLATYGALAILKWSLESAKTPPLVTQFVLLFLEKQMKHAAKQH